MKHADLVFDDLWEAIEPFLPMQAHKPNGRPCIPEGAALAGIICLRFVAPDEGT